MMSTLRKSVCNICCLWGGLAATAGFFSPVAAQTKVGTTQVSLPIGRLEPWGVWSGNSLVAIQDCDSVAPIIHVYDRSDTELQRVAVRIPEAGSISIANGGFVRSPDGSLAIAGVAFGSGSTGAGFLALIAEDGKAQTVVRIDSYDPSAIVFAADGVVWMAGHQETDDDYLIIRRFDKNGRALNGVLWRKRFPATARPFWQSYLVASKDRVGWFSAGVSQYIEFSLDGKELASYRHPVVADTSGVALCEDNSVFAAREWKGEAGNAQSMLYSLDRQHGTWRESTLRPFFYIYGCSETTLASTTGPNIDWMDPR